MKTITNSLSRAIGVAFRERLPTWQAASSTRLAPGASCVVPDQAEAFDLTTRLEIRLPAGTSPQGARRFDDPEFGAIRPEPLDAGASSSALEIEAVADTPAAARAHETWAERATRGAWEHALGMTDTDRAPPALVPSAADEQPPETQSSPPNPFAGDWRPTPLPRDADEDEDV